MEITTRKKRSDVKKLVDKIVADCEKLAFNYVKTWKPVNKNWDILEGCAYLRLSDDSQVIVEKGSLEQQINIAVSEAEQRSTRDKVNYKITEFYIEPGITAKHDRRPKFQLMQENIRQKRHSFVVLKELSRASREFLVWKKFFKTCIDNDCEIIIRGLPFNPNNPTEIFQLDILAAFAEYESNQTSKRIKESNFSAMITSGKFNSSKPCLGLDIKEVNGEKKVGLFKINKKEIKTVELIMEDFLKYGSYQVLIKKLKEQNIKNKNGKYFTRGTLLGLLTNKRLIGKWEVNSKNKEKNQLKLMPYDRYKEVDLPHGPAICMTLWKKVQDKIENISGKKDKDTLIKRVYPLTGLLVAHDGTTFGGQGAWSKSGARHNYYYNKKHKIRLSAQLIEDKIKDMLVHIINNSDKMQKNIKRYVGEVDTYKTTLNYRLSDISNEIEDLLAEKEKLNKRLDFLLEDSDLEEARAFKAKFKTKMKEIEEREVNLELSREKITKELLKIENYKNKEQFSAIKEKARKTFDLIEKEDPTAFKGLLRLMFREIVLGEEDSDGNRDLKAVFHACDPESDKLEDVFSSALKMVEVVGIEPTSKSVSGKEHYVCSHIGASDGCENFVKFTKPGGFFNEIFPTSSQLV